MKINRLVFFKAFLLLSFRVIAQTTLVLQPGPEGKDAQIHTIGPDNNYGNTVVFKCMAWTHSGVPGVNRALIDFDLSGVPSNALILEAKFNLYFATFEPTYVPHSGENMSYLATISERWDENLVTWNNQPSISMDDAVVLPQSTYPEQDYTDIEVTEQVRMMKSDPDHHCGWMLLLDDENPYNCLMFASSDCANPALRPKLVIVYKECELPEVTFSHTIQDQTVFFEAICPTAHTWLWDFGDGYLSTLENPFHEYEFQGNYEVCLHVEDSCGVADYCEEIEVCQYPVSGFDYGNEYLTIYFTDASEHDQACLWSFGDGYYSDLENPWHLYDTAGYYEVCLQTYNDCGSDTLCQLIYVELSGIDEFERAGFKLYPNPAGEMINITGNFDGIENIFLKDLSGRTVFKYYKGTGFKDLVMIPAGGLIPGMYILRMEGEKSIFIKKIIKN